MFPNRNSVGEQELVDPLLEKAVQRIEHSQGTTHVQRELLEVKLGGTRNENAALSQTPAYSVAHPTRVTITSCFCEAEVE